MTRRFQISFAYSFDLKQLSVYLSKTKIAEVKLNLTRLNNISITLSGIRNHHYHHHHNSKGGVQLNVDDFNIDELVYLIADELTKQSAGNGEASQKQAFLLKCFFQSDVEFKRKLGEFLLKCNDEFFRIKFEQIRPNIDVNQLKEHWLRIIDQNCLAVNESSLTSLNTLGKMYHQLMHSNYMNLILRQEYLYAVEFNRKLNEFQLLGDNTDLVSSRIDSVKLKQQRLFSKLLFKMFDEFNARSTLTTSKTATMPNDLRAYKADLEVDIDDRYDDEFDDDLGRAMTMSRVSFLMGADDEEERMRRLMLSDPSFSRIEESYTIQLGAQLKTTHNLRLVRCDILDYCRDRFKLATPATTTTTTANTGQKKQQQQQQQQQQQPASNSADLLSFVELHTISTAMSLFSENKLCALVILVDACLDRNKYSLLSSVNNSSSSSSGSSSGGVDTSYQFYQICQRNGFDFQFPSIEAQVESAIACINAANGTFDLQRAKMNIGDFFITKHSNLSQTHVVFHLAAFDSSSEENSLKKSDLSSRHPVILGLRNILKTCINHNIASLTFPLLLAHSMTEEMTISWVMKRAELVLKCMKGFMIEFVQWGAQDSRFLQFIVPQGLIDETFNSLSSLIKTIFRESRTYLLQ